MSLIADPSERVAAQEFVSNLARFVSNGNADAFSLRDLCGPCLIDAALDTYAVIDE